MSCFFFFFVLLLLHAAVKTAVTHTASGEEECLGSHSLRFLCRIWWHLFHLTLVGCCNKMWQTVFRVLSEDSCFFFSFSFLFFTGTLKCATSVGGDGDHWPQPTYIVVCKRKLNSRDTLVSKVKKTLLKKWHFKEQIVRGIVGNSFC